MKRTGQILIMGVLLLVILMIAIPVILFINRSATKHSVASQLREKGQTVAQEGISYGFQQLSQAAWPYTGGGATTVASIQGSSFTITTYPNSSTVHGIVLENYQAGILSTPLDRAGQAVPGSALFATVSRKTIGAKLPTGLSVSASLQLMHTPVSTDGLWPPWGPVVVFDTTTWTLGIQMDYAQFPRKFSQGPITGIVDRGVGLPGYVRSAGGPNTDNKEYWANTQLGVPAVIDLAAYATRAKNSDMINPIVSPPGGAALLSPNSCSALSRNCAYYNLPAVAGTKAIFGAVTPFYTEFSTSVIFVNGDVEFDALDLDLHNGAFIVNGNLTLNNPGTSGLRLLQRVPPTAKLEWPYIGTNPNIPSSWPTAWPVGQTICSSDNTSVTNGKIHFRGFLYVTGNVTVVSQPKEWNLDGVLRVDGTLTAPSTPILRIWYDDQINHTILVTPAELMIDGQKGVNP